MSKVLNLKPKAPEVLGFVYENATDLADLIAFVGKKPVVDVENGKTIFMFRKHIIKDGSVVFRNEYGDVVKVMSIEEMETVYDVENTFDFSGKVHTNVVKVKVKKETSKD